MVGACWRSRDRGATEAAEHFYQLLTISDGRIVQIRDCRSRRQALRMLQG